VPMSWSNAATVIRQRQITRRHKACIAIYIKERAD
jgi:hypothetical protein